MSIWALVSLVAAGIAASGEEAIDKAVVCLTAHSDEETMKRALHSRMYGYITKPFTAEHLRGAIEQATELHRSKRGTLDR